MGTRPPWHLERPLGLLADVEWPGHDEAELERADAAYLRMAADADYVAQDAYAGARAMVEANEGSSVDAFADYCNQRLIPGTARVAEFLRAMAFAHRAMAEHVREAQSELDRHVDPLNDDIWQATYAAESQGIALSDSELRELPAVKYTGRIARRITAELEERLTEEVSQLRSMWLSGGSGTVRPRLAIGGYGNGLLFNARSYEEGAGRFGQAALDMLQVSERHGATLGRAARQLRQWRASIPAAAQLETLEAEVADAIRACVADLQYTSDNLNGSRVTMLGTEDQNTALFRQLRSKLDTSINSNPAKYQTSGFRSTGRIASLLNGSKTTKNVDSSEIGQKYREHPYGIIGDTPE